MPEEKKMYTSKNPIIQKIFDIINRGDFYAEALKNDPTNNYYSLYKKSGNKRICKVRFFGSSVGYKLIFDDARFNSNDTYQGVDFSDLVTLYDICKADWASGNESRIQRVMAYLDKVCAPEEPKEKELSKQQKQENPNQTKREKRILCPFSGWCNHGHGGR